MRFKTFDDVQTFLDDCNMFHMELDLSRMKHVLDVLCLDSPPYKVVQVVGTNGKGSTSTFLSELAKSHGLRVGLYTSPHFVTPRERIRINGTMLAPVRWVKLVEQIVSLDLALTYFELLTTLAILAFAEEKVDLAILEAGLGGQYDATTATPADLVCYTPIHLDHEKLLGDTIEAIALEKAQAMRSGKPALTCRQFPEASLALQKVAKEKNVILYEVNPTQLPCDVSFFDQLYSTTFQKQHSSEKPTLGMAGIHQHTNAQLALAAWQLLSQSYNWKLSLDAIYHALSTAYIPGRFQYIPPHKALHCPPVILDGGHNPFGLETFAAALEKSIFRPGAVIFSCFSDKNVQKMVPIVERIANGVPIYIPTIQVHERAMCSKELVTMFGDTATAVQRLNIAFTFIKDSQLTISERNPIVIFGSLYLLGEFFTLYPHALE